MKHSSPITYILILLNIIVAIVCVLPMAKTGYSGIFSHFGNTNILYKYALIPSYVLKGQYYRLFSSMFIHSGFLHLLSNMYALHSFGRLIEGRNGSIKMALIYLISGLCGSVLVMLITKNPNTVTVGASGAIFGLMSASYILMRRMAQRRASAAIAQTIIINVIITFTNPTISIGGHIGGLIGGLVTGFLFCR